MDRGEKREQRGGPFRFRNADRDLLQLDVLRPATYDALAKTLRSAGGAGKPYHIVHFDGHGAFVEMDDVIAAMKQKDEEREKTVRRLLAEIGIANAHRFDAADTVYPKGQRAGRHGYLCFENPSSNYSVTFTTLLKHGVELPLPSPDPTASPTPLITPARPYGILKCMATGRRRILKRRSG